MANHPNGTTSQAQEPWSPSSWRSKPIKQDVTYDDDAHLERVLKKVAHLPPLVTPAEIEKLRAQLKEVALGNSFLLQGGDCAELFEYCSQQPIEDKLKVLLQMSLVLVWGARTSVVRIARMAGQYAKPRSKPTEMYEGEEITSYRGDNVNGFDPKDRKPDPERLLDAYFHSAATLNYIRAIITSGFADLHYPWAWNLDHVRSSPLRLEYQGIVDRLLEALDFIRIVGADAPQTMTSLNTVDIYMSHEGLLLEYEQSLTRYLPSPSDLKGGRRWYNVGAHFLWIGDRTRQPDGAHVEYMRGIENPVGIKVGPSTKAEDLPELLNKINPSKDIGKVTLITRYGAANVEKYLPAHIAAVKASGHVVVWQCDPMHGNGRQAPSGVKTRHFIDIITELSKTLRVHKDNGSKLNGVHLELTGEKVTGMPTNFVFLNLRVLPSSYYNLDFSHPSWDSSLVSQECIGGSMELSDLDLSTNYQTYCDPRLNYEQSLDVAFLISKYYANERNEQEGNVYRL